MTPVDTRLHLAMRSWPEDLRDLWEERAAILEYDAHLPRIIAEQRAYNELKAQSDLSLAAAR